MKKTIMTLLLLVGGMTLAMAQKPAQIKFDETSHNFGTFSKSEGKVSYTFTYTNVGEQPLVINRVMATCGCTVYDYTKEPTQPGEKGEVKITYNTNRGNAGHFKKNITVQTNGAVEISRLYIEGDMTDDK